MEQIHIGQIIKDKMREKRLSARRLSEQLSCNRSKIYKLQDKPSIDTSELRRISILLKFDFFKVLSEKTFANDSRLP
ncbi:MAG: XRE family transcriptional regulator [Dysgonamonadaceae bacterium]|jgi:hypothetical protein|nr:XRE family transcriptional regulator [Dysgonamonadaceae bacterium]